MQDFILFWSFLHHQCVCTWTKKLSDQIQVWQKQKSVAKTFLAFARALGRFYNRVHTSVWRHSRKLDLYELATVTPVQFLSSHGNYFSRKNSGEQQKLYGNPVHIHLFTSKTDIEMRGQKCNRKVQGSSMLALNMG